MTRRSACRQQSYQFKGWILIAKLQRRTKTIDHTLRLRYPRILAILMLFSHEDKE